MDNNEKRKPGAGRGLALLQMWKREQSEDETTNSSFLSPGPQKDASTSSVSSGKPKPDNLLQMMRRMRPRQINIKDPPLPASGEGSGLNVHKSTSSTEYTTVHQPSTSAQSDDHVKVTHTLSQLSVQPSGASELTHKSTTPILKHGTCGKMIDMKANYINLTIQRGKGVFQYEIKFTPDIDSRPLRTKLLNQHLDSIGRNKIFDGTILYLPQKLSQATTTLHSIHPLDQSQVTLKIIFKKEQLAEDNVSFFNILLGRIMRALSLVRIGQHSFNANGVQLVPQHKLEVWPGFVTAVNHFEGGLKLCVDTKHRVMRTETMYSLITSLRGKSNFKDAVIKEIIGISAFTRYNNKTYRIDDIAWDKTPKETFEKDGQRISLIDYYKTHWNLQIKDVNQPLLVHRDQDKLPQGGTREKLILLVPELCFVTGLTDSIRSDFRVMKDLDALTKASPNERRHTLLQFIKQIKENDVGREILSSWGLELENELISFPGRVLPPEVIYFGNHKSHALRADKSADWTVPAVTESMLRTPHLMNWCLICTERDKKCAYDFQNMFRNVALVMGMNVTEPKVTCLSNDRIESYLHAIRNNVAHNVNLVVIIFPTNRSDKYSAVKRLCLLETPVPSQVIIARTISRGDKLKSITQKIALQINCKLGGALWALNIPMNNCMICGIDVFHAGVGEVKSSVAGFVASLDRLLTKWHSRVCIQGKHQELIDLLQGCLISAVEAYHKYNGMYPDRIIIYRDGVGEGQLETVAQYEIKQILATFKNIGSNYLPKLSVIIVQKRINTRLFAKSQTQLMNPPAGTIVDTNITKNNYYDFFLVSQNIRHGCVSPTHYIVLHDSTNMKVDHVQQLTYKLCHLYYNFTGTIKVPAPCQYAHKLVYLVGQSIRMEPDKSLSNVLYYL